MSDVTFDLGCELDNYHGSYRYMVADSGDLDLYVIAGPDPAAVTRRFTWLTGEPALMPRWALGYSGSTMSYTDQPDAQARLAGFVAKLEEHDIGCGSFHLSSGYTSRGNKRYVFNWNRDKFPNPAGFVQSYRAAAVEVVPNIKPVLLRDHPRYAELANAGLFVADSEGKPIEGEVVSLTQRPEAPLLFDVKSELPDPRARATEDGPAQVATDAYRKGWDAVWGRRRRDQSVN